MRRARGGDRSALSHLVETNAHAAWRMALAVGRSSEAAEQAVVEAFTMAAARIERDHSTPFSLNVVRAAARAAGMGDDSGVSAEPDPAPNKVVEAFGCLAPVTRAVLWLALAEEGTVADVARTLHMPEAEVRDRYRRGIARLRGRLAAAGLTQPHSRALAQDLRALVVTPPEGLGETVVAWWAAWTEETVDPSPARRLRPQGAVPRSTVRAMVGAVAAVLILATTGALAHSAATRGRPPTAVAPAVELGTTPLPTL